MQLRPKAVNLVDYVEMNRGIIFSHFVAARNDRLAFQEVLDRYTAIGTTPWWEVSVFEQASMAQ